MIPPTLGLILAGGLARLSVASPSGGRRGGRFVGATFVSLRMLRGVMTMINWVSPPVGGSATTAVATFEEAVAWLEEKTGKKLPIARKLLEETKFQSMRR